MELIRRLLVGLLGMIDSVVYNLVDIMYGLLMDIANATPFGDGSVFETFASRVYALLGLFMLFKVSFSLIKYIVNPDEFNDQMKGGKKLVTNILITLVLIVIVPIGFDYMGKIQTAILNEGIMENLILGTDGISVDRNTVGKKVMASVFTAFYAPDDDGCALVIMNETDPGSACDSVMSPAAVTHYRKYAGVGDANEIDIYQLIHGEVDGEPLFMLKNASDEKSYAINYMFIISTIAGIFTAWIFLTFCVDVAIRTVKLGFLQLIAPIPIISYIDPNSAKNGMFSKWIKEVGKTFIDLFVRLAAVYFAITLITAVMQNTDMGTNNFFAKVFIILGILVFAGQIPKLVGDLLGVKLDGNFSLNPLRKVNSSPIASAVVGGATGLVAGTAANLSRMPGRFKDFKEEMDKTDSNGNRMGFMGAFTDGNKFRQVDEYGNTTYSLKGGATAVKSALKHVGHGFSPLAGGASAMVRGGAAGSKGKGSALGAGLQGATVSSQRRNARDGGYGMYDKVHDKWTDIAGIKSKSGTTKLLDDQIKANQQQIANYKRDEQAYSQQLADIARGNPMAYNQAFEETVLTDEHGSVRRDDDGKIMTQRTYETYDDYFVGAMAERQIALNDTRVDALISAGTFEDTDAGRILARRQVMRTEFDATVAAHARAHYTDDDAGRAQAREELYNLNASANGILEQNAYQVYENVISHRDRADDNARKLEKRNKELQGYKDARNGKPKDK